MPLSQPPSPNHPLIPTPSSTRPLVPPLIDLSPSPPLPQPASPLPLNSRTPSLSCRRRVELSRQLASLLSALATFHRIPADPRGAEVFFQGKRTVLIDQPFVGLEHLVEFSPALFALCRLLPLPCRVRTVHDYQEPHLPGHTLIHRG